MLAMVATARYLLLVDLFNKVVTPIEGHRPEYYGISWLPKHEDLVLSHSAIDTADLIDIASYTQSEVGWISSGAVKSQSFLSAPHQILCGSDGRVICTNTGRNAITVIDLNKPGHFQEAQISAYRWDRLSKDQLVGDHINSVYERDGKLFVLAHRHNQGSQLAVFSYPDLGLISIESAGQRIAMHNIWITDDGQKISCHSEAGALVDLNSDAVLWQSGNQNYTRGLAASGNIVLVGDSRKSGRDLRRSSLSGLWVIDRSNWQAIDYICLGPYGVVNEVRLLDVADDAHHGHTFSGLSRLQTGDGMLTTIARERLQGATLALSDRHLWRDFEVLFGAPEIAAGGVRIASADNLCLALRKTDLLGLSLSFEYQLIQPAGQAHVSAVVGYQGDGGDTDMFACLLQRTGDCAASSIWRHDGNRWLIIGETTRTDLPLSGLIRTYCEQNELVMSVDATTVLRIPLAFPIPVEGKAGFRFIGSSIRPIDE